MEFRVLGPLEVLERDVGVPLVGLKQRTLLAILLLHANEAVAKELLIHALWHEGPPQTAHNTLQAHISRLRRSVGHARIESQAPPGYLLHLEPGELDVTLFERLAAEGRRALAAGDSFVAGQKLREALGLWRGAPLADFTSEGFAQAEILRLQEIRLAATEDRIEADLASGLHADLVGELEALVVEHRYRERLRGQLMLALYRSGRQAEALEVYRATRSELVEQLGIEPSPALHRLETAILLQDPALELPERHQTARTEVSPFEPVHKPVTVVAVDSVRGAATERIREILSTQDATVETGAGQIFGLFGSPVVREDDAARAARAALRLREADPRLRIAIESGKVVESSGQPLADALLEAALVLAKEAAPGEVVIGQVARSLLPAGTRVKRRAGGRDGFLLSALAERRAPGRPLTAPLIGRRVELGQLLQTFESTRARGTSHLATVLGVPGIGKSRLAEELEARLCDKATVLVGRCPPYGEGTAFSPLSEVVRRVSGDATPAALLPLLESDEQARLVASRLAGAFGTGGAPGEAEDTLWAFRRLLEALARTRPTVVVFEDVHWADETLLDFVEHVAEWSRGVPLLLLCLARSELLDARPAWGGGKLNAVTVSLEPLSDGESSELMELLAHSELPEDRRRRIGEVAEGNPLFIEQMLALARDQGCDADLTVPPTIEAILAARLDRLEPGERRVLERAAVVGREFWLPAVEELSLSSERAGVLPALRRLVRKDLVLPDRTRIAGEESFRFRHLLIRNVAYDFIPKPLRAGLHERLGGWLEEAEVDLGEDLDAVIGYHLEQAYLIRRDCDMLAPSDEGLAKRAAERLAAVHKHDLGKSGLRARLNLLERAVALLGDDAEEKGFLVADIATDVQELGDIERARSYLVVAADLADRHSDAPLAQLVKAKTLRFRQRYVGDVPIESFVASVSEVAAVLEKLGAPEYAAHTRGLLASTHLSRGRAVEAERLAQIVSDYATLTENGRLLNLSQRVLVGAWLWGPSPIRIGIARCERILASDPPLRMMASAYGALSVLVAMDGRFEDGRRYARRDRQILEELGFGPAAAGIRFFEAYVELLAGEAEAATEALRPGLQRLMKVRDTLYTGGVSALMARALYCRGKYREARAVLDAAESIRQIDLASTIMMTAVRGRLVAEEGDTIGGLALVGRAVEMARRTDHVVDQAETLRDYASVLLLHGEHQQACGAARRALALEKAKGNVVGSVAVREFLRATLVRE